MPILLPLLDVVFVGLVGTDPGHIDRQILSADARLKAHALPAAQVKSLAANDGASADVARQLGDDGVVVAEVVGDGKHRTLRLVTYNAEGAMTSMSEVPLGLRRMLSKADLAAVKSNLDDEVTSLLATKHAPKQAAAQEPAAAADDPLAAATASPAAAAPAAGDSDDPLGGKPTAAPAATPPSGDDPTATEVKASTDDAAAATAVKDRVDVDAGFGVMSRSFDPGASTVRGYNTGAVSEYRIDAAVHPLPNATLGVAFDHSLGMQTELASSSTAVASLIGRWEITAAYSVLHGKVDVAPLVGVGERAFAVDTPDMTRSPDGHYTYAIIGGTARYAPTPKLMLHGNLAVQPLVAGEEPTITMVGASSRWGLDVGVSADYFVTSHIYAHASADYQRIQWSWAAQNNLPGGSASDSYPTASVSIGARY